MYGHYMMYEHIDKDSSGCLFLTMQCLVHMLQTECGAIGGNFLAAAAAAAAFM